MLQWIRMGSKSSISTSGCPKHRVWSVFASTRGLITPNRSLSTSKGEEKELLDTLHPILKQFPESFRWILARSLFLPTFLWRVNCHYLFPQSNPWWGRIDKTVLVGALPLGSHMAELVQSENVVGIVNCCEEYSGSVKLYKRYGVEQMRIPTFDYFPPSLPDIVKSIQFIAAKKKQGGSVYVHCKAGRGRSAVIGLCWLMAEHGISPEEAHSILLEKRPVVSRRLTRLRVVREFQQICGTLNPNFQAADKSADRKP